MEIYFPFLEIVWLTTDTFHLKLSLFQWFDYLTLFPFPIALTNIFFQRLNNITKIFWIF